MIFSPHVSYETVSFLSLEAYCSVGNAIYMFDLAGCFPNVLGFLFNAIFIASVGYTTTEEAAVVLLTLGVGMGGLVWSGFSVNIIDVAPRFAGLLMGISNCIATLPGIVGPPIAGALTPNEVGIQLYVLYSRL